MVNSVRQDQFSTQFSELFVNADIGDDTADGSSDHPYKTITHALQQVTAGLLTVRLSPGIYSAKSGERFPIVVPDRVSIAGAATGQGQTVVIQGGGEYDSPTFGTQSIAIRLGDTTLLNGVTVTNPTKQGTGIWIESVATIANSRILNCGREGIFATDRASLAVVDCLLQGNRASGISLVRHAKGQIRRSIHQGNRFGLVISDYAAPLIIDSQFIENRMGIVLLGSARPVLRSNRIECNQRDGLAVFNHALPDLGHPQDPADNFLGNNEVCDLRNATSMALVSVGNDLAPDRVQGDVTFAASQIAQPSSSQLLRQQRQRRTRLKPVLTPVAFPSPSPPESPISDLAGHWAEPFVHGLLSHWTIHSFLHTAFEPDQPISRAEYAVWVVKTFNLPACRSPQTASDVPENYWAISAITQAQRMGFLSVSPNGMFHPEAPLTRLQAIVSLVQGLGVGNAHPAGLQVYRDRAQIPSWAATAVASATQNRLIVLQREFNRLQPAAAITRAEVAAWLHQGLVWLGEATKLASPHIVNPAAIAFFSDMQGHWAADWICGLVSQGVMGGTTAGKFEPDRPISRADYATLLANVFRPTPDRPTKDFVDVATHPAKAAIDQVYRGRLMGGFADDTFRPAQPVTRVQALLALVSGLKCPGASLTLLDRFIDADAIPKSARSAVAAAVAQWLVVNHPTLRQLRANQAATRAEIAAMMYQALVRCGQASVIPSPYIVDPRHPSQHRDLKAAPIVVLDPGHGGADLGVVATIGGEQPQAVPGLLPVAPAIRLQEKDIVLSIAQQVATLLQQQGIRVLLTRTHDRYVDAATRVRLAEEVAADLLVSFHVNAAVPLQSDVNGLETYYASNSAESKDVAQFLHTAIVQSLNISDRHVHPAEFYLLRSVSMPAIHLEMAYLTGDKDALNLANPDYCRQMAGAVANGILQYVRTEG